MVANFQSSLIVVMVIYPDMYPTSREVQGQIKIGIDGITALSPYGIYSAKRPLFDRKKSTVISGAHLEQVTTKFLIFSHHERVLNNI